MMTELQVCLPSDQQMTDDEIHQLLKLFIPGRIIHDCDFFAYGRTNM